MFSPLTRINVYKGYVSVNFKEGPSVLLSFEGRKELQASPRGVHGTEHASFGGCENKCVMVMVLQHQSHIPLGPKHKRQNC